MGERKEEGVERWKIGGRRGKEEETHEESENYGILLHILCTVYSR